MSSRPVGYHTRRALVLLAVLCGAAALAACSAGPAPAPRPSGFAPADVAAVDAAAGAALTDGATGAIVAVSDPRRGTLLKAYGTADTGGEPLTPDASYRIASVTKTFTADAVLRLVDQRRVALADPVAKYVPDLPNGDRITVRDLLAMRSGVYDFADDQAFFARYTADPAYPGWTPADALAIMRAHAAEFTAPDRQTVYCNSNYVLLGYVIEKATGEPADRALDGVARRLELRGTFYPSGTTLPAPFVHGYLGDGTPPAPGIAEQPHRDVTVSNPAVAGTAGAIVSTVPDMARYAAALGTGAGLSPAMWQQRQTWSPLSTSGVRLEYGLGITRVGDWIGHDGSIFGYSNMVFYLPSERAAVVVMSNVADEIAVPSQNLFGEVVKRLYPGSLTTWP
ncbi:MAG TPA: serine hydrolase domain-containing protein [Pseudonocardia sp.]